MVRRGSMILGLLLVSLAGIAMFHASPASATSLTYDFGTCGLTVQAAACPNVDTGFSHLDWHDTLSLGPLVGTTGWDVGGSNRDLFIKQAGAGEHGLGLVGTAQNEITTSTLINIDATNLAMAGITSGTLMIQSLAGGDTYKWCNVALDNSSSTSGLGCSGTISTGSTPTSWSLSDPIIGITAVNNNVLLAAELVVTRTSAPEPGSLMLLGTGLLGLVLSRRRRRS